MPNTQFPRTNLRRRHVKSTMARRSRRLLEPRAESRGVPPPPGERTFRVPLKHPLTNHPRRMLLIKHRCFSFRPQNIVFGMFEPLSFPLYTVEISLVLGLPTRMMMTMTMTMMRMMMTATSGTRKPSVRGMLGLRRRLWLPRTRCVLTAVDQEACCWW